MNQFLDTTQPSFEFGDIQMDLSTQHNADYYNKVFKVLLNNDLLIYGNFERIPGVWFCKWYNNEQLSGYNRGDFFWLNCEDNVEFIKNNWETIKQYSDENPQVVRKLPNWQANNDDILSQYQNVLSGYIDDTRSKPISALYEIGELSCPAQMIVSQRNNNQAPISDTKAWKRFFVNTEDDYDTIIGMIYDQIPKSINKHIKEFHFGNEELTDETINSLTDYVDADFSNVKDVYCKNFIQSGSELTKGIDNVQLYVKKPIVNSSTKHVHELVWFRLWKSGYLEHGGTIDINRYLNYKLSTLVTIPLYWKFVADGAKAYIERSIGPNSSTVLSVNEESDVPPGDNIIKVLYELNDLVLEEVGNKAPTYDNTDYTIMISPIQQTTLSGLVTQRPYANIGNFGNDYNMINNGVVLENITKTSFSFRYNAKNTCRYYTYYTAGFYQP